MPLVVVIISIMIIQTLTLTPNITSSCRSQITWMEMNEILKLHPCVLLQRELLPVQRQRREHRRPEIDGGQIDIKALQTTINDHRTMINYLVNNSINATYVTSAFKDQHIETGPILKSWRDILIILEAIVLIGILIYLSMTSKRSTICDPLIATLFSSSINRINEKKGVVRTNSIHQKQSLSRRQSKHQARTPPTTRTISDAVQFNSGYFYE